MRARAVRRVKRKTAASLLLRPSSCVRSVPAVDASAAHADDAASETCAGARDAAWRLCWRGQWLASGAAIAPLARRRGYGADRAVAKVRGCLERALSARQVTVLPTDPCWRRCARASTKCCVMSSRLRLLCRGKPRRTCWCGPLLEWPGCRCDWG